MKLLIAEQTIHFDKQPSVEELVAKINELLTDDYYFSHLIVDGLDVFEEPEPYLADELPHIAELEVVAQTAAQLINNSLLTAEDYLKRAQPEMTVLADCFYQQPSAEQWASFSDMLEGMQWLHQIIASIDGMKAKPSNWDEYLKLAATLEVELKNLEEAVENSDTVLMADMIQYELLPLYESLGKEIQTTIDTEGTRDDVN